MNKQELIAATAGLSGLNRDEAERAVSACFRAISSTLTIPGEEVRLIGFGTFSAKRRAASKGVNPRTGEAIDLQARGVVKFRAGKSLSQAVTKAIASR